MYTVGSSIAASRWLMIPQSEISVINETKRSPATELPGSAIASCSSPSASATRSPSRCSSDRHQLPDWYDPRRRHPTPQRTPHHLPELSLLQSRAPRPLACHPLSPVFSGPVFSAAVAAASQLLPWAALDLSWFSERWGHVCCRLWWGELCR